MAEKLFTEVVDTDIRWRVEVLLKIVMDLELSNQITESLVSKITHKATCDVVKQSVTEHLILKEKEDQAVRTVCEGEMFLKSIIQEVAEEAYTEVGVEREDNLKREAEEIEHLAERVAEGIL
jgi:hypothetical protein